MRVVQKVLSLIQKEERSWTFVVTPSSGLFACVKYYYFFFFFFFLSWRQK